MKASQRSEYGPPSVLRIEEVARPIPNADELLVKVHATTVNRTDCGVLSGRPYIFRFFVGFPTPRFSSTGTDFAGVVEATGKNVTRFKPGDRIFGFNDEGIGSHREYMAVSQKEAMEMIPKDVSFVDAVASIEGPHYAYNFISKVHLSEGDAVLINGVTGAIGSSALQLLRRYGVAITAVCGPNHLQWAQSMGAKQVYDYTREDFTQKKGAFSFIFDAVGKSSYSKCKHLLNPKGTYISSELGYRGENLFRAMVSPFLGGKKVIFPFPAKIGRSLSLMKDRLEKKEFAPLIDRTYRIEQLAEAFQYVASGQKVGNVILDLS